jgi:Sodium:dicarboxylate symporter family
MSLIVRLAPLGVLGAVGYTVGKYGAGSLRQLVSLVVLYYASSAFFVLAILGGIMRIAGLNIFKFLSYLREELTIVLGTASSDAVLPQIMHKLEQMGDVLFPGGDDDRRDAIADQIAERPRHADKPVDREHEDEADRRDAGDRVEGGGEDYDRRARHAVRPFRGDERDAEDQQQIAER